ncbi:hypothetical protein OBBRIDRAFT_598594 [Obba rivulosa]|uniref:Secreted protein n=1 Tax=Obba rivulosa TaxID=1052685 RepID=A0A8E2AU67_9APHY|nr:hypothetical protein OBBRIDRAFT_598594 [Obba rivulosa]
MYAISTGSWWLTALILLLNMVPVATNSVSMPMSNEKTELFRVLRFLTLAVWLLHKCNLPNCRHTSIWCDMCD